MAWTVLNKSGTYSGKYRAPDNKIKSAGSSPDEKVALHAAQAEEARVYAGTWKDTSRGDMTFATYFETEWIVHRTLEINGEAYYWGNYRAARFGVKKRFGDIPLTRIKRPMIQAWVTDMKNDGMNPRTIKARVATLQVVLAAKDGISALNDGRVETNEAERITLPPIPTRQVKIYTPDQVDALIDSLHIWWRLLVWTDSETGLRWGELLGLRVEDVDFLRKKITVNRTIIETSTVKTGNGTPYMVKEYPKDEDLRTVGLGQETLDMLSTHIATRKLSRKDFLFSMPVLRTDREGHTVLVPEVDRTEAWPEGLPIGRSYFRGEWRAAIKKAKLPPRRIHDLRASFISWLLDDPLMAPQHVMDIAGHSRWDTTRRYAQGMGRAQELGVEAISNIRQRYRKSG